MLGMSNLQRNRTRQKTAVPVSFSFSATLRVAENRGADFVQYLIPSRSMRQNKVLDPTALVGWEQASLPPATVLAGQHRD